MTNFLALLNSGMKKFLANLVLVFTASILFAGCATNPVTGKSELSLISEASELEMGREAYDPLRQTEGGDYVADKSLTAYVNNVGQKLAAVSDRDLPYEFKVVNSPQVNAWALPGGKIAINRGLLLELENEAELAAVLGHEIVHAAAKHSVNRLTSSLAIGLATQVIAYQASVTLDADESALIGKTAGIVGGLLTLKYSRDDERESDYYGTIYMSRVGYDPLAAVTLQQKFFKLKNSARSSPFEAMLASHPPSEERVENNRSLAQKLGLRGELGTERYQQATAHLRSVKPAYDAYEDSQTALSESNLPRAEDLARKAIKIEPNENLFHLLLGDILTKRGKPELALQSYNRAAEILPNHYAVYERRALVKKSLDDEGGFRRDMTKAAAILPTSVSYLALGQLAEQDDNPELAIRYFGEAASANTLSGQKASAEFNRLDPLYNPQKYLKGTVSRDEQGLLSVTIRNPLKTPVSGVSFTIAYGNPLWPEIAGRFTYRDTIEAGDSVTLTTQIGPVSDDRFKKRRYRLVVDKARAEF